jgi:N-acetyl sugar amidotransferase
MRILVIADDYPRPDFIYGDVFVHARVKEYIKSNEVLVVGHKPFIASDYRYEYESVNSVIAHTFDNFSKEILKFNPDVVAVHFMNYAHVDFLLGLNKPIIVFAHGFGVLSWKRRLMNYRAPGDIPYLLEYIKKNRLQLAKMKEFITSATMRYDIRFVFVSNWVLNAAANDIGVSMKRNVVIPNGIDTDRFKPNGKNPDHRKKILLLRSFRARNYANDISVDAILLLSKKSFFNELQFTICGEGYLFDKLTQKLKKFPNVSLQNFFIENKNIPLLHKEHGIFLCPSRLDTQGVSMCEAMASGLVPITCPIGGIPEYATDQSSSFQVGSAREVAEKIEYLFYHPDEYMKMSGNAREEIVNKCDLKDTVKRELDLMHEAFATSKEKNTYHQCVNCVLDNTDDPSISFNRDGVCNYCQQYKEEEAKLPSTPEAAKKALDVLVDKIKKAGEGKKYDCILGLSGGVDSTYLALRAKQFGLRPLAVHFDNGWDSELAVKNIENIVSKLGLDLYTIVVDWDEFKDLQLSFIKASVIDIELTTDHAIMATMYKLAFKYNVKYILSGHNIATELVLPTNWYHDKLDHINIQAIHKQFGTVPLQTFPMLDSFSKFKLSWKQIKSARLLNLMPYNKTEVKKVIQRELDWRDYGGKHYESIFTRFYQGYILVRKFKVDKRKAHLSNLICSGQMSRAEVIEELKKPPYEPKQFEEDYTFVLKKFNLTHDEFETLMNEPIKKHTDYEIDDSVYKRYFILRLFHPGWKLIKKIRGDYK